MKKPEILEVTMIDFHEENITKKRPPEETTGGLGQFHRVRNTALHHTTCCCQG